MLVSVNNARSLNTSSDLFYEDTTSSIARLECSQVGEVWQMDHILKHKSDLLFSGRNWTIVDNLIVHDAIKFGGLESSYYIENYKQSLINLSKAGIKVVCYNFMPVFYKVRTHFTASFTDPYAFSMFDPIAFAVFDMHILKRDGAQKSYNEYERHAAELFRRRLSGGELLQLKTNVLRGVQGSENPTLAYLHEQLEHYKNVSNEALQLHYLYFKAQIEPIAKALGITLCFNNDNPAGNLMNLPGI